MVYGGRSSGSSGRYDGYGGSGGSYGRRDSGPRRSTGSTFGAIDLPDQRTPSSRPVFGGRLSVSPWASGESPSRHSWGAPSAQSSRGGVGSDPFSPMGPVSGGGQSNDTLNMAANLVASILQQNQQQQRRPEPFGNSRIQPLYSGSGDGYGHGHSSGYRGSRAGFHGRTDYNSPRSEYGNKYDNRRDSYPPSRGRTSVRGTRGTTRSRGAYTGRTPARRTDTRTDNKNSATKKKPEAAKKAVKTTQQALDEAKAAALEKQMEKEDAQKPSEDAEGQDLLAKGGDEAAADTKDGAKPAETAQSTSETNTEEADGEKKDEPEVIVIDAEKEKEKEKKSPAKPQREKIDSKYLNCSVCNVCNITTEQGFSEHVRGRRHQTMMQMMEQRLEQTAKLIRIEVQVASKRAEIERQRRGKSNAKDYGYCGMCNIRVYEELNEHRTNDPLHAKLKKFLHPRCCGLRFDTPVMYERHLLSFSHLRKQMVREKEQQEAGQGAVVVHPCPPTEVKLNGDAAAEEQTAKEGETAEKPDGEAAADKPEGEAAESESAVKQEAEAMETDAEKPKQETKPAEEEECEPVPVMYDPEVAVARKSGVPFSGILCTICRMAMPDESWMEHCKSRVHYNRYMVALQRAEMARREAAAEAARKAARAAKAEAIAAAEAAANAVNAEAEEVVVVVEGEPDEAAAEDQSGETPAAEGGEPAARGTKRPVDDDDDAGGDAKIAATEPEADPQQAAVDAEDALLADDEAPVEEVEATAPAADAESTAETPAAATESPAAATPKTAVATPAAATPKPAAATPAAVTPNPAAVTPKPATATPKPAGNTPKPFGGTPNRGRGGRGGPRGSPRGGFARRSRGSGRGGRR